MEAAAPKHSGGYMPPRPKARPVQAGQTVQKRPKQEVSDGPPSKIPKVVTVIPARKFAKEPGPGPQMQAQPVDMETPQMQTQPVAMETPQMQTQPVAMETPQMQSQPGPQMVPQMQSQPGPQMVPQMQTQPGPQMVPQMQTLPNMMLRPPTMPPFLPAAPGMPLQPSIPFGPGTPFPVHMRPMSFPPPMAPFHHMEAPSPPTMPIVQPMSADPQPPLPPPDKPPEQQKGGTSSNSKAKADKAAHHDDSWGLWQDTGKGKGMAEEKKEPSETEEIKEEQPDKSGQDQGGDEFDDVPQDVTLILPSNITCFECPFSNQFYWSRLRKPQQLTPTPPDGPPPSWKEPRQTEVYESWSWRSGPSQWSWSSSGGEQYRRW